MKEIILVTILMLGLTMPLVSASASNSEESNNVQAFEVSIEQVPCNAGEDTLGCTYRAMLEKGMLEHPRPLSELRRAFKIPMRLYL